MFFRFAISFPKNGGERGIRTPGPVTVNGFQDRRIRPLCQLSSICYSLDCGIISDRANTGYKDDLIYRIFCSTKLGLKSLWIYGYFLVKLSPMTLPYLISPILQSMDCIKHGFFTRLGGVSTGQFDSLNCSLFSGDNRHAIRINRGRVRRVLGADTLFGLKQIHSNDVVVVNAQSDSDQVVEADALATNISGVALGVVGADCAGILLADAKNRVIGAAHGGWQGALFGITDNVIEAMCHLGASKNNIVAAIGPAIQKQSYEVGNEFEAKFLQQSNIECADCFAPQTDAGVFFDLSLYLERRLLNAAIARVDRLPEDTYSDENRFFSYRRSCHHGHKHYGRQLNAICIATVT